MLTVYVLYLPARDAYVSVLDVAGGRVIHDPQQAHAATFHDYPTAVRVQKWVLSSAGEKACSIHPFDIWDREEEELWQVS